MYIAPLLLLLLLAIISPWVDWHLSHFIYTQCGGFIKNDFLLFLYNYGFYPAWICSFVALYPLFSRQRAKWRRPALLYLLTFALVNGLLVTLLKEFWPRPRPVQVIDFGGCFPFRPFYHPLFAPEAHKSFPSGHAASGFVFFALFWGGVLMKNRALQVTGLLLGLFFGLLLSSMRIMMGAHFFFDTVASAALMWYFPPFLIKVLKWKS